MHILYVLWRFHALILNLWWYLEWDAVGEWGKMLINGVYFTSLVDSLYLELQTLFYKFSKM